jgi:hypothetical protein
MVGGREWIRHGCENRFVAIIFGIYKNSRKPRSIKTFAWLVEVWRGQYIVSRKDGRVLSSFSWHCESGTCLRPSSGDRSNTEYIQLRIDRLHVPAVSATLVPEPHGTVLTVDPRQQENIPFTRSQFCSAIDDQHRVAMARSSWSECHKWHTWSIVLSED